MSSSTDDQWGFMLQRVIDASAPVVGEHIRRRFYPLKGRGYQKWLATELQVAESTISSWVNGKQAPSYVALLAMNALYKEETTALIKSDWIVVCRGDCYEVVDISGDKGRVVATGIERLEDADLIAFAPDLCEVVREVHSDSFIAEDSFDDTRLWRCLDELVEKLPAAPSQGASSVSKEEK